jgi:ketosteroid isomerase-like protein
MIARRVAMLSAVALAVGCAPPAPPPKPDAAAVKAATTAFWAKWAAADIAGDIPGLIAMVSPNAAFDGVGMKPMMGRAAWEAALKEMYKTTKYTSLTVTPGADWADGDHYYEQGSFTEGSMTGNKGKTEYGRYFVAFAKDSAGNLLLERGAFVSDSTPAMKPAPKTPSKTAAPSKAAPAKSPAKKAPTKKSGR